MFIMSATLTFHFANVRVWLNLFSVSRRLAKPDIVVLVGEHLFVAVRGLFIHLYALQPRMV